MRTCETIVACDSGMFDPRQLQPVTLLRLAFAGSARWMQLHAISLRRMIREHQAGVVMWDVDLRYAESFGFFDGDELALHTTLRVRNRGGQLEGDVEFVALDRLVAKLTFLAQPLRLSDDPALSGTPARLPPAVIQMFRPDEVVAVPATSLLVERISRIESVDPQIGRAEMPFLVGREQCEVADQWFWPEAAALCGRARARAAVTCDDPAIRAGLSAPLVSVQVGYRRPLFLLDEGRVETAVYRHGERVAFVHRLFGGPTDGASPNAIALELV